MRGCLNYQKTNKTLTKPNPEAETNLAAAKINHLHTRRRWYYYAPRDAVVSSPEGVIEGVFDGQVMIGPDGKNCPVPANIANPS